MIQKLLWYNIIIQEKQNNANTSASEDGEIDKKNYQIMHLKKSFNEYEKKSEAQIEELTNENTKLKYRINILLDTINKLENK